LARGIAQGRLEWAFGGMPPTLGGGLIGEGLQAAAAAPRLISGARMAATAARTETTATAEVRATSIYRRPSGATTPAQRASVQGRPCVHCGSVTERQVAGHRRALVREHYETGTIDRARMRALDAVQPECPACSTRDGAALSRYSQRMRKLIP
jgi:hypothetical protein